MLATQASDQTRGNLLGISAILFWSMVPSLIRLLSESFGAIGGAALMYSAATLLLICLVGWPSLRQFPLRYLLVGGALFVSYEMALALSLGYAQSRLQAIELGLLNYLWPCLTVLLSVLLGQQRASLWLVPGLLLSLVGVSWILSGGDGISPQRMLANASANPLSYGLALAGAFLWATYCCVAKPLAKDTDAIVPFFALTSLALWLKFLFSEESLSLPPLADAGLVTVAAVVMALGYAAWNRALLRGNLLLLAAVSYATPVLASLLSSLILSTALSFSFWQGAALVTAGSLVCWWATRGKG